MSSECITAWSDGGPFEKIFPPWDFLFAHRSFSSSVNMCRARSNIQIISLDCVLTRRTLKRILFRSLYLVTLIQIEIALNGVPKTNQQTVRVVHTTPDKREEKKELFREIFGESERKGEN